MRNIAQTTYPDTNAALAEYRISCFSHAEYLDMSISADNSSQPMKQIEEG